MSWRRTISLASLCFLAVCIVSGCISQRILHRPINPSDVVGIKVMGNKAAAGPIDPDQVVKWFNEGTDPRRSPGNVGHTTPTGMIILELKSGGEVWLGVEGQDFLVVQDENYYYLRQPDLGMLLDKLENW